MLKKMINNQLVRQLFGAVVGMLIALFGYAVFGFASDAVKAHILSDDNTIEVDAAEERKREAFKNIGELARERMKTVD